MTGPLRLVAHALAISLALSAGCVRRETQRKDTTVQSNGHGPGSGALRGSGAGINQGHARADTYAGTAAQKDQRR